MNRPLRLRNVRCGLFMHNQCLFHEHVIFTHVHQHLSTYTHCKGRFIVPEYYGIYATDCSRIPMFNSRTLIVIRGCNYTIRCETGAINRPLRLRNVRCDCPRITTFNPRTRCYTLLGTLYISFFLKIIYWIKIYIYFH